MEPGFRSRTSGVHTSSNLRELNAAEAKLLAETILATICASEPSDLTLGWVLLGRLLLPELQHVDAVGRFSSRAGCSLPESALMDQPRKAGAKLAFLVACTGGLDSRCRTEARHTFLTSWTGWLALRRLAAGAG